MKELKGADVASLLDRELLSIEEYSTSFISEFAAYENIGLKDNRLNEEILSSVKRLNNFKLIISVCGIYLGYTYARCEHFVHFDDRNKDCSEYCSANYEMFLEWYKELAKSDFPFREKRGEQYFLKDIALNGNLLREAYEFATTHPTLQQACMNDALAILCVQREGKFRFI